MNDQVFFKKKFGDDSMTGGLGIIKVDGIEVRVGFHVNGLKFNDQDYILVQK